MLPAERDHGFRGAPGRFSVVTEDFEHSLGVIRVGERRGMSGFDCARDRLVHELPRACDVAEAPSRESQISGRRGCQSPDRGGTWLRGLARGRKFAAPVRNALAPARNRLGRGESILKGDARPPASVGRAARSASRRKLSAVSRADPSSPRNITVRPPTVIGVERRLGHRLSPSRALRRARRRLSFPRRRSPWPT